MSQVLVPSARWSKVDELGAYLGGLRLRGEPLSNACPAVPARPAPRRAMRSLTGVIRACSADAQFAVEMEGSGFDAWARAQMRQIGPRILLMVAACAIARLTGLHMFSAGLCRCDASVGCYDVLSGALRVLVRLMLCDVRSQREAGCWRAAPASGTLLEALRASRD